MKNHFKQPLKNTKRHTVRRVVLRNLIELSIAYLIGIGIMVMIASGVIGIAVILYGLISSLW